VVDSIIPATASAQDATLRTEDEHFKDMEGVNEIYREENQKMVIARASIGVNYPRLYATILPT
jgi:hypothetical protein